MELRLIGDHQSISESILSKQSKLKRFVVRQSIPCDVY